MSALTEKKIHTQYSKFSIQAITKFIAGCRKGSKSMPTAYAYMCTGNGMIYCCRNGHLNDLSEDIDHLRPSASDPNLCRLNCDHDALTPVKIYQSNESYITILITRVSCQCLCV